MDNIYSTLPKKKYQIIYADPPWKYKGTDGPDNPLVGGAHSHYPTIHIDDLKALDVGSIADDDCLLFLWATGPKLDWAVDVGSAWGFSYVTIGFVWDKVRANPGYYTMSQCEICLIFKRGKIPQPRGARNIRQFISMKKAAHSTKPHAVRHRIESMFPFQTKIELFARGQFEGWDVWGLETERKLDFVEKEKRQWQSRPM
ncbi:MAG: transcriptional regulator [Gammaproteobacteria bacterium AqS3]|nr:transcriptional regulator [Gammaproteobacteria bacterium AqS3]